MRLIPLILLLALSLAGCGLIPGGGHSSASDLAPGAPPADADTSSLPSRIDAGVDWLWASYTRLKERVDPASDAMKRLYVAAQEALVAARAGDWLKALSLYASARELITEIAAGVGK